METTQESKLDALKKKFQGELDLARKKLDELKQEITTAREEDRQQLSDKREEIHQRVEEQKQRVQELREHLEAWRGEKASQTHEAISSWREKRELDKLQRRAERAEDSAVDAIYIAMVDTDAAEEAVLEAIAARIDFELVVPAEPAG